ncbi:MFS transporter [Pseudonocardia sp. DSM 110487]|uniref:MFS transporter n=1 Tax=Pseudonocardia sp. DSM 110487 TaxID=2865833 RepID=UPI001C697C4F|nr:MFS transporter [Pseudonocardia sp. DSM 110487]QYN39386.1 MFS transporter [Pseudonocardia sp. DSM 110487]
MQLPTYRWWTVAALAVTATAGYGVLTYAFAVLLVPMQEALGADRTAVTGAQTVSLLAAALAAVPAGRWLDRRGGRTLMVGSSVLATVLVLAWSQVNSLLALYVVSIGLGVASAGVLYEAAFAVVVSWFRDPRRGTAMLAITIAGGFASTIFMPLTAVLVEAYGWRQALVVLAVIYGGITVPLHLLVRRPPDFAPQRREARKNAAAAVRDPGYWLIAGVFVAQGIGIFVVGVHLVAYLRELGHASTVAANVAGLLGVMSVTGRVVTTFAARRYGMSVVAVVFALQAVGLALLPVVGNALAPAVACVLAIGLGFGVSTIARPTLLADRYGVAGYATLAGLLAAILTVTKAFAPLGAAWLRTVAGTYTPVMAISAIGGLVGAAGLLALRPARSAIRTPVA